LENYFGQLSAQQTKKYIAATSGVDDELSTIFALGAKLISNVTYPPMSSRPLSLSVLSVEQDMITSNSLNATQFNAIALTTKE
jgi:hypothetical protein